MPGYCSDILYVRCAAAVFLVALFLGCRNPASLPPDHPAYFDKLFRQMDSMGLPPQQAFRFVDSVYASFPSPGTLDLLHRYDYKGNYYYNTAHDFLLSGRYVDSALMLLSSEEARSRYPREYAKCLIDKAENYQHEDNLESAFFYYRKGLEAIKDLGDSCTMAEYTQRIAMASYRAGRFSDARNLFDLAFHQFAACRPEFRAFAYQQCNLDNMGECYSAMKKWDSAAFYFDSTLAFISREAMPFITDSSHRIYIETARAVVLGNLGDYALFQRDTAKAWQLYRTSIAVNMRPLHDSGNALAILLKTARLNLAQGRLAEARAGLDEIRTALDHRSDPDMDLDWQHLHAEWLGRSGNWADAWASLNAWNASKDSLHSRIAASAVDIPRELVHLEDKYTIELLKQRDHVKTIYLLLAVLIVIMLIVIAFLIRRGARRSNVHIRQLNRLNKALRAENRQTQTAINALNEDQAMYLRSLKSIAHDLRNPVGAISSAVSLLKNQSDLSAQTKTWLDLIGQSADQSLHLVGGIMHLDLPIGSLQLEMIDLSRLLETCVSTLQFRAGEKKQIIHLEAEPVTLLADHDKLWRVIINLLDNAIKFSPDGADIVLSLRRHGNKAVISVSDKGMGIPKNIEGKLFTVDAAVKRLGTAGETSFGLGLAIVSQIIKAHGGTISVHSQEHQGTTFRIELLTSAA
ncbi:MAG: HAMP domain-containing histidine kinase [Bacteroidetes bacterium]|nr:HAMP domain-containing histidine kinase [Bacteroidota bacterium]